MKDKLQLLISMDSRNCNMELARRLPYVYNNADIHICVTGIGGDKFDDWLPFRDIITRIVVPSRYSNYSLGINILIKELKNKLPRKSKVLLLDGWSLISPMQVMKYDMSDDLNFDKNFVTYNMYHDTEFGLFNPEKQNEPKENVHLAAARRLGALVGKTTLGPPLVLTNMELLYDIETGLEEELWTEKSRIYLINQLKKIGLTEHKSKLNGSLLVNPVFHKPNIELEDRDDKIIEQLCIHNKSMIFINSNLNAIWGKPEKLSNAKTKNGLPYWSSKYKSVATNILNKLTFNGDVATRTSKERKPTTEPAIKKENVQIKTQTINRLNVADVKLSIDRSNKVLILVNSEIEDLISITPMIKRLYSLGFKVDILLEDILSINTNIIDSFMVNKIYDRNNALIGDLKPDQYNGNIIRTKDCDISLKYPLITEKISHENKVFENFSYIYGSKPFSEKNVFRPYCHWEQPKLIFKPNTFCVSSGIHKKYLNKLKESVNNHNFETFLRRFTNSRRDVTIIVLNLISETNTSVLKLHTLNEKQNFMIYSNISPINAAGIIKNCKFCITHSQSDVAWLAYGLRTPALVLTPERNDNPFTINSNNMDFVFYNAESDMDAEIGDYIWSNIL